MVAPVFISGPTNLRAFKTIPLFSKCKLSLAEVTREPKYAYATITTKTDFVVSMHAQYYRLNSLNALCEQTTRFGALIPSLFVYGPKSSKSTINRGRAKFSIGCY